MVGMVLILSMAAASVLLSTQNAVSSWEGDSPRIALTDEEEEVQAGNATTMVNQTSGNTTGTNSTS